MTIKDPKWVFLGVGLLTVLLYLPSSRYGFVSYDDHSYVYLNENVLGGLSARNAIWALGSCGYAQNWHPLTWISLQADASVAKLVHGRVDENELAHVMHFHNVLLHAANAVLLLLLMMVMCKTREALVPGLLVLLWSLHPLRTEVVCWASERKELLCVFWMLLSLFFWVRRDEGRTATERALSYALALVGFLLSLLAKPLAVSLPAVMFAWDWMIKERAFKVSVVKVLPFGVASAITCLLTMAAQGHAIYIGGQFTLLRRIVLSLAAPIVYVRQSVWPSGLSAFYPTHGSLPIAEAALGGLLLVGMGFVVLRWLMKRERWMARGTFAVTWAYISLIPMLGIVKVGDQPHSDRYTYWIGCAAAVLACALLKRLPKQYEQPCWRTLASLIAAFSIVTWNRMPVWADSFALYSDSIPKSWGVQPVLAMSRILCLNGSAGLMEAEQLLREASTRVPFADIEAELANVVAFRTERSLMKTTDGPDDAFTEVRYLANHVLSRLPHNAAANEALGIVSMKEGQWKDAIGHLETALKDEGSLNKCESRIKDELEMCRRELAGRKIE